jgi:hypothetical protein
VLTKPKAKDRVFIQKNESKINLKVRFFRGFGGGHRFLLDRLIMKKNIFHQETIDYSPRNLIDCDFPVSNLRSQILQVGQGLQLGSNILAEIASKTLTASSPPFPQVFQPPTDPLQGYP